LANMHCEKKKREDLFYLFVSKELFL